MLRSLTLLSLSASLISVGCSDNNNGNGTKPPVVLMPDMADTGGTGGNGGGGGTGGGGGNGGGSHGGCSMSGSSAGTNGGGSLFAVGLLAFGLFVRRRRSRVG
jgi:MYXO-CTERM domain-containing protein